MVHEDDNYVSQVVIGFSDERRAALRDQDESFYGDIVSDDDAESSVSSGWNSRSKFYMLKGVVCLCIVSPACCVGSPRVHKLARTSHNTVLH